MYYTLEFIDTKIMIIYSSQNQSKNVSRSIQWPPQVRHSKAFKSNSEKQIPKTLKR